MNNCDALIGFSVNPEIAWTNVCPFAIGQKTSAVASLEISGTSFDVAWAMSQFGCTPMLFGAIGTDHFARLVEFQLKNLNIAHMLLPFREKTCVASIERETLRHLSFKPPIVRVDPQLIDSALRESLPRFQVVTGLMPDDNEILLANHLLAEDFGIRVLNPREALMGDTNKLSRVINSVDWLFLNRFEAAAFLHCDPENISKEMIKSMLDLCQLVVVTCDGSGVFLADRKGNFLSLPSFDGGMKVDEKGAGDCFLGSFLSLICKGYNQTKAFEMSTVAAGLKVTRMGTTNVPTYDEVLAAMQG